MDEALLHRLVLTEPVVVHLELFAVVVDDYDSAIDFFTRVLRFDLVEDSPSLTNDGRPKRWVVVRPPGAQTGLLLACADSNRQAGVVGQQFAGRVGLFLRIDDFDEMFEHLCRAGVEFVTQPRDEPYGQYAVFLDIAGNRWDLLGPDPRLRQNLDEAEAGAVATLAGAAAAGRLPPATH